MTVSKMQEWIVFDIQGTVRRGIFLQKKPMNALFLKFILMKNSTCYVDCLLADSQHNMYDKYLLLWIQY